MFKNKILVHMKTFDVTIDHILDHYVGSKLGLYVSFLIPLYYGLLRWPHLSLTEYSVAQPKFFWIGLEYDKNKA